jgi:uncharacterized OB-fold protein
MPRDEKRPTPIRTDGTADFFDAAKRGEFMLQHCGNCDQFSFTGYRYCPNCYAKTEWRHSDGIATVKSFAVVTESSHDGFKKLLPYAVATAVLGEGPTLSLRYDGEAGNIAIGQNVKVAFQDNGPDEATPVWVAL